MPRINFSRTSARSAATQVYLAIIASLLISLWTGRKPTRRTLEMIQFYFIGWATEDELMAHLESLKKLETEAALPVRAEVP